MRDDKEKECVRSESQSDTYIEKRFEEACATFSDGNNVLNEWRQRKARYISYTSLIAFDSQHYSRHDVTHSIKILEAIELIVGKERIDELEAGDLWLLLESAYFHDIGMAVTYADLTEIWQSNDFKQFLNSSEVTQDRDLSDAKKCYEKMDDLVHHYKERKLIDSEKEEENDDAWLIKLERKLLNLITAYIRKNHSQRAKQYMKKIGFSETNIIPDRLYKIVTEVAVSHGEDFSYILTHLKYRSQGFAKDYIHPQFVAAMLRLGDLLDMDNNRFNLRALEHFGLIPWTSFLHLRKHKAMIHILISQTRIEAEAEDENFEVCQVTQNWFQCIQQEVTDLICYWGEIAPEKLSGCLMQKARCKVYHPHAPIEFHADWQKRFEVDKAKLTDLLIGTNIYDIKLEFLREYVQNALDASKMQLWLDLKQGKYQFVYNPGIKHLMELTPMDIPREIYNQYVIDIKIDLDFSLKKVCFEIADSGIGMEEACLDVISRIGSGWKGRKRFDGEIDQMLPWLRPTGGFGIGIQSAFMLSDQIEILTKSDSEMEPHRVILNNPKLSGAITVETGPIMEPNGSGPKQRGTTVIVNIDLEYFQKWDTEIFEDYSENEGTRKNTVQRLMPRHKYEGNDVFDKRNSLEYVVACVENYLKEIMANTLIPIRITAPGYQPILIESSYKFPDMYWKREDVCITGRGNQNGQIYQWVYDKDDGVLSIWEEKEHIYTYIKRTDSNNERKHTVCFKNVCVVRDTDYDFLVARDFSICIDFMGHSAEDALKVHRNAFNENFPLEEYVKKSIQIFIEAMEWMEIQIQRAPKKDILNQKEVKRQNKVGYNLYGGYIPFMCLVYFGKNISIPPGFPKEIEAVRYKMDSSTGNWSETEFNGVSSKISVSQVFNYLSDMLSGRKDTGIAVFLPENGERKEEKSEKIQIKIQDIIRRFHETEELIIYKDQYIYSILKEDNSLDCVNRSLQLGNKTEDIALFTKKEEILASKSDRSETFFTNAYEADGRFIFSMPESTYYEKLEVSKLPFGFKTDGIGPYLISPIDQEIRNQIIQIVGLQRNSHYEKKCPYEQFAGVVKKTDGFDALLEWVYDNQVEEGKYTKDEIKKEYEVFLKGIYDQYLSPVLKKKNQEYMV